MLRKLIFISTLALGAHVHAAEAGKVIFATGAVHVADQPVREGARVEEGQMLATGADGFLYVKTVDNGLFILRPNTRARIVAYHIDAANPANNRIKLELISGIARSKSGDAVKLARQNFRFNTPVAAIGVRGTDFTVYTDEDTSRVAVLTGGVVVSGFGGACSPEGGGPCEGAASRELSAAQRGQLLQVKRGQQAPQLLPAGSGGPDQVSPPRRDEPLAKQTTNAGAPVLDPQKQDMIDRIAANPPGTPTTAPPVLDTGDKLEVQLPERTIQWGRWTDLVDNRPATTSLHGPAGTSSMITGDYVVHHKLDREYVAPERGTVGFTLKGGEATVRFTNEALTPVQAQMQNGVLNVDFGKRTYVTSFDLITGGETFKMLGDGLVASDGRFGSSATGHMYPERNNMRVDGVLSNAEGGSAAYVFQRRLDSARAVSGVTYWAK